MPNQSKSLNDPSTSTPTRTQEDIISGIVPTSIEKENSFCLCGYATTFIKDIFRGLNWSFCYSVTVIISYNIEHYTSMYVHKDESTLIDNPFKLFTMLVLPPLFFSKIWCLDEVLQCERLQNWINDSDSCWKIVKENLNQGVFYRPMHINDITLLKGIRSMYVAEICL